MLSILIIDDTPDKIQELKNFILSSFNEIKTNDIDEACCTNEGLKRLLANQYDLVLLDLNISKTSNGMTSPQNALDFLDLISEMDEMNLPAHILGITRLENIKECDIEKFEEYLWSLMRYGEDYNGWEEKLRNKIQYLISSKRQLLKNPKYDYDVAIINALQVPEQKWVKIVFGNEDWKEIYIPNDKYNTYYEKIITGSQGNKCRIVVAYQHQMASTASSALTTKVIYNFRPKYLFMTGIAAGIDPDEVALGDVLVASEVWDGASGKHKDVKKNNDENTELDGKDKIISCFLPDPRHLAIDAALLTIVNRLKEYDQLKDTITAKYREYDQKKRTPISIHVGPMASVPAVIASEEPLELLQKQSRKLLGIEMESYGMFYAAVNSIDPRPVFIGSFKSASDYATKAKDDNYQDYASFTSASFLKYLIQNELGF